jgi:hypothetical protein
MSSALRDASCTAHASAGWGHPRIELSRFGVAPPSKSAGLGERRGSSRLAADAAGTHTLPPLGCVRRRRDQQPVRTRTRR